MTEYRIKSVAVIGLGKMGRPIARHLLSRGYAVSGFDVSADAVAAAETLGVKPARSPAAAAAASDLVIVVVGFDRDVESVIFGEEGIREGAHEGCILAVASTIAPTTMQKIAARLRGSDLTVLDIPLCRGEEPAETGELLIMGGGDEAAFEAARPAFACFANSIHYLGPVGAGQVGKMVNNLIMWSCQCANYEGLKLGESFGVARAALTEALLDSSAQNWALETAQLSKPAPWAEKDMMIVLGEADRKRLALPMCGTVKEVMKGIKIERGLPLPSSPED